MCMITDGPYASLAFDLMGFAEQSWTLTGPRLLRRESWKHHLVMLDWQEIEIFWSAGGNATDSCSRITRWEQPRKTIAKAATKEA